MFIGLCVYSGRTNAGVICFFSFQSLPEPSISQNVHKSRIDNPRAVTINPKTGKAESVLADMEAIYPDWPQMDTEMSFEELRAASRGWLYKNWAKEETSTLCEEVREGDEKILIIDEHQQEALDESLALEVEERLMVDDEPGILLERTDEKEGSRESRSGRPKKTKIMEVKGEPQTSMAHFQP